VALVEQAGRRDLASVAPALLRNPAKLRQAAGLGAALMGVTKLHGYWPLRAEGDRAVEALVVGNGARERRLPCDLVACGFGLVPETMLAVLLGVRVNAAAVVVDEQQRTSVPGLYAAGELTGVAGVDVALAAGLVAGSAAAGDTAAALRYAARLDREVTFARAVDKAFALRAELSAMAESDTIVCRCEDVSWADVRDYSDARDAKLKTRCGMGPCQGRVCGPALRLLKGWDADRVRPPLFPIPTAALAEIGAAQTGSVSGSAHTTEACS
jgi:NADPH-dependent 2,4-dienoyl-CoA reductase/sulfur reductase-like enzyme